MQTRKIEESDWKTQVQKEMSVVTQVSKHAGKFKAGSKGILGNSASGIGTDQLMRLVDNVFGSPVQNIASVNVPVIGTVGPIDFLNYLVHAGKLGFKKEGLIAVLAAKSANGVLPNIKGLSLPQANSTSNTKNVPSGSGSGIGF